MKPEDGSIYGTFNASLARSKDLVTDSLNNYLVPVRTRRRELEKDTLYIRHVLERGIEKARDVGSRTLQEVRDIMKMGI